MFSINRRVRESLTIHSSVRALATDGESETSRCVHFTSHPTLFVPNMPFIVVSQEPIEPQSSRFAQTNRTSRLVLLGAFEPEHHLPRHRDPLPRWRRAYRAQFSKYQYRRGPLRRVSFQIRRYLVSMSLNDPCRRGKQSIGQTKITATFLIPPKYVKAS